MAASPDVIVVGAGITGASTAYHLKKKGVGKVLLLERKRPAAGGTGLSAAVVRHHYSNPLLTRLVRDGIGIMQALPGETGHDPGFVASGYFFLLPPDLVSGARENVEMQRGLGVRTGFLTEAEIGARMPWLNPDGVGGVVFEPDAGYADPVQSTEAFIAGFKALGGEPRMNTPCRTIARDGDRVAGVVTDDGRIACGTVVNAAGPWASFLAASAGIELKMRSVREQDTVWQARHPRDMPTQSISNAVDAIYMRPMGEGRFVIGRGFPKAYVDVDPYNYKETADEAFIADVAERAQRRFPPFAGARLVTAYAALYDVTPDWYPVVGPRQGLAGYCDASGGSGHGFKLGFAIGRELAGWIVDGRAADDFARLSHDRYAAGQAFVQKFGGNRG